jgi:hypothetical protein
LLTLLSGSLLLQERFVKNLHHSGQKRDWAENCFVVCHPTMSNSKQLVLIEFNEQREYTPFLTRSKSWQHDFAAIAKMEEIAKSGQS